jgi:hypothetical protein
MVDIEVKKKKDTSLIPSKKRAEFVLELYRYLRPFPSYKKIIRKNVNIHNLFETGEIALKNLLETGDEVKAREWIHYAKKDLDASRILRDTAPGLSLYHMQQSVEKCLKGTIIGFGLKKESNIIKYNHQPQKFLIDLISKDDILNDIIENKFPFPGLKRPEIITSKKVKDIKKFIDVDKKTAIDFSQKNIKGMANFVEDPTSLLHQLDLIKPSMKKKYERFFPSEKERKNFRQRLKQDNIEIEDVLNYFGDYSWLLSNLLVFIIPLSTQLWIFESVTRYPDEGRNVDRNFSELEAFKSQKPIIRHLEVYIEKAEDIF